MQELFSIRNAFFNTVKVTVCFIFFFVWTLQGLKLFEGGGDDGAEDDDGPGQIHPDQKDGERGQCAIDGLIGCALHDDEAESLAQKPKQNDGYDGADAGVGNFDLFVGDQHVNHNQGQHGYQARQHIAQKQRRGDDFLRHKTLQGKKVAAQGKGRAQKQRSQSNDGPVQGDFGFDVAGLVYFKYEVEAVFYGGEHQNGGNNQTDDADGGHLGGRIQKVHEIVADFLFDVGNKVFEDKVLKLLLDGRKTRKGRKNGQTYCKQRHNRNQRRVAQRG